MYVPGSLMYELVEGVLSVGPRLTPHYGSSAVIDLLAAARHVFSVALHVTLLEVGGESNRIY